MVRIKIHHRHPVNKKERRKKKAGRKNTLRKQAPFSFISKKALYQGVTSLISACAAIGQSAMGRPAVGHPQIFHFIYIFIRDPENPDATIIFFLNKRRYEPENPAPVFIIGYYSIPVSAFQGFRAFLPANFKI